MAQPPPRKGAYSKHVQQLNKDQLSKLQSKHAQEVELLENIRTFMKQKTALEKQYADSLLKLTTSYLNHKIATVPDIQVQEDGSQSDEVNVYNLWRRMLDENEKLAKARLAAVQVFQDEVTKNAKAVRNQQQAKNKKAFERIGTVQKELQISISELDRTKRIYFNEETEALDVRSKAQNAEEIARGRKKAMKSLFVSKSALKKNAGILSAKQEEMDIKSTGARNDYILNLASANAHQKQYYQHDLQDTMRYLEGNFYERISHYLGTISRTELLTCSAQQASYSKVRDLAESVSRKYNYECYTKVYPSLGQLIQYEHEAPEKDDIRIITPSEHDGGYSLNYEARQNASKLNQSVKTIKAYRQRIKACHLHKSKGLKHEPNDTGGPDLDTKINELEIAICTAETDKVKAEARLEKLREGGISVDEYIDAFVYSYQNEIRNEEAARQAAKAAEEQAAKSAAAAAASWDTAPAPAAAVAAEPAPVEEEVAVAANADYAQPTTDAVAEAEAGWGSSEPAAAEPEPAATEAAPAADNWASWGNDTSAQQAEEPAQAGGWADFGAQNGTDPAVAVPEQEEVPQAAAAGDEPAAAAAAAAQPEGRTVDAVALYVFEAQNEDELSVMEGETIKILIDECDEEGWVMALNAQGGKGFVPQNYVQVEGQDAAAAESEGLDAMAGQDAGICQPAPGGWGEQQPYYGSYQMDTIPEAAEIPQVPPPIMEVEDSSDEEDSDEASAEETESAAPDMGPPPLPPPGPPPAPAESKPPAVPPPPAAAAVAASQQEDSQGSRPPSISLSTSIDGSNLFCKALYDYDATGSDEISFEEGDQIRILKKCPNGVDDGWWLGEIKGKMGLFPSIVVEEASTSSPSEEGSSESGSGSGSGSSSASSPGDGSSLGSPPSAAPPAFGAPPPLPPPPLASTPEEEKAEDKKAGTPPGSSSSVSSSSEKSSSASKPTPGQVVVHPATESEGGQEDEDEGEESSSRPAPPPPPSKPAMPCVQISIDEVPDLPRDEEGQPAITVTETIEEEVGEQKAAAEAAAALGGGGGGLGDNMEIVVTAPTPTVQSPITSTSEQISSEGDGNTKQETAPAAQQQQQQQEQQQQKPQQEQQQQQPPPPIKVESPTEAPRTMEDEDSRSQDFPDPPSNLTDDASPATEDSKQEGAENSKQEEAEVEPPPARPADSEEDSSEEAASQRSNKNSSSASSASSSSSSSSPALVREIRRGSTSESESESESTLPPDKLELKQLKKLDGMKESTA